MYIDSQWILVFRFYSTSKSSTKSFSMYFWHCGEGPKYQCVAFPTSLFRLWLGHVPRKGLTNHKAFLNLSLYLQSPFFLSSFLPFSQHMPNVWCCSKIAPTGAEEQLQMLFLGSLSDCQIKKLNCSAPGSLSPSPKSWLWILAVCLFETCKRSKFGDPFVHLLLTLYKEEFACIYQT